MTPWEGMSGSKDSDPIIHLLGYHRPARLLDS